MLERAQELGNLLLELRRDFHCHPELSFREYRTARKVAERLGELELAVRTGVGKTGVVADLGEEGPRIALRADMDALPLQEANDVSYASPNPGVMHACGHDVHVACRWVLPFLRKRQSASWKGPEVGERPGSQ